MESHEELMDPLCVQTTALAHCVSGGLHAKRTVIAEVVVDGRGRRERIVSRSSDRDNAKAQVLFEKQGFCKEGGEGDGY